MINIEEAFNKITTKKYILRTEKKIALNCKNLILAQDILAPIPLPPFKNSAVDGFAVRSSLIAKACIKNPKTLVIDDIIGAGEKYCFKKNNNKICLRIMTGALIPECFDAVIMQEDVKYINNLAQFLKPAKNNQNIRFTGEDVSLGNKILSKGRNITELADGNTELVADAAIRKASRVVEKMGVEDLGKSVMRRQGLAENQHSHQFFSGMSFKSHSFKHKLISFTRDDTLMNLAIINFFKRGMKPSFDSSTSRRFLRYPPRFHIRFMKYDDLNPFLPVIRPCVCTNVEVSYTGSGTWSSFRNGSPVDIDLTLQFNEVELPYD